MKDISKWQEDFRASHSVFLTFSLDSGGEEWTGNCYESREAAELEQSRRRSAKIKAKILIREVHIHSLDLAKRRWL